MAKPSAAAKPIRLKLTAAQDIAPLRYLESSAVLAALLEHDAQAIKALRAKGRRVTSALTLAEGSRAILRARLTGRITPEQERAALRGLHRFGRRSYIVAITDAILTRAGRPFPVEPVRTLDGIHLATLESFGESPRLVTVVSRDARVRDNAKAMGYIVEPESPY